jgi:hypothetical protein
VSPSNCTPPDALVLEKPLPDDPLRIVTKGEKEDLKAFCSISAHFPAT